MKKSTASLIVLLAFLLCVYEKPAVAQPMQIQPATVQAHEKLPPTPPSPAKKEQKPAPKGYTMTARELAALAVVLDDSLENGIRNPDKLNNDGIKWVDFPVVSASSVAKTYEENQVAGDHQYFDKRLYVTGTIASINSGLGNEPYVVLVGDGNPFMQPHIQFENGKQDIEKIARLKKKQAVAFVCYGGGSLAGSVVFKRCEFADAYLASKKSQVLDEIKAYLHGGAAASQAIQKLSFTFIVFARLIPESADCSTPQKMKKCSDGVWKSKNKETEVGVEIMIVSRELMALGVDVGEFNLWSKLVAQMPADKREKFMTLTDDEIRAFMKDASSKKTAQKKKTPKKSSRNPHALDS